MVDQYIFSGSLPENASTYVIREADAQLYEELKQGKFCYVLNSRQSGKSSLRVRTMQRLRDDGVQCAAVDLSAGGIQNVPPEQWYADLIDTLIDSFGLDLDFGDWWEANQLNSLVTRFRKFLEEVLLVEVQESIVIFIDEIDSVLSLNFPTDDFFALIRACYNKRVDNPEYNRLTFCLLGVASPSNLISDKQRTPFNIGKAISLKGFQLHEAEPLENGLRGKFNDPQTIMQEILQWTGGQPFLTQKLCQFMVEESEQDNPRSVEQVVRSRIIENWESLDEPEHLRTIQARILRDEQRAGYLLELYQQVRLSEEQSLVIADETLEQSELQLSGLVVRQQGKLRIYNQIYREIFDFHWIDNQLNNLRPYSENFRFWVASGGVDESRLLRGKALQQAEEWARDKNLSYQDKQFLAASKEKEIQEDIVAKEQEATVERERRDREATETRNQMLREANRKIKQQLYIGITFFSSSFVIIGILGIVALSIKNQIDKKYSYFKNINELQELVVQLKNKNVDDKAGEIFLQTAESIKIQDYNLTQALLNVEKAIAYSEIEKINLAENKDNIINGQNSLIMAQNYISKSKIKTNKDFKIYWQIIFLAKKTTGDILLEENNFYDAINSYSEALKISKNYNINPFERENQVSIVSEKNMEAMYVNTIKALYFYKNKNISIEAKSFLQNYYMLKLENLLINEKWKEADILTTKIILHITNRQKEGWLDKKSIDNFPCHNFQLIDQYWTKYSKNNFGFSIQKRLYLQTKNRLDKYNDESYKKFGIKIGWYQPQYSKNANDSSYQNQEQTANTKVIVPSHWKNYEELNLQKVQNQGMLPTGYNYLSTVPNIFFVNIRPVLYNKVSSCKI
ncbi:AAA-like domain-containing protein [Nostoc sp. 'Peltigera membranacea cyanobiont' 232]|uniref:AAA-like domain-containing protein n=1 Tax=Nostoc sp. 'Peltigera membranacea cyanobiont' 232 TaxID=2014531 RepID=UPI000B95A085|nr:AAA-like domain-containing protein [Nostoc sp. 'Peltigera membranacea cyanobiont' 232]OYE02440.1 hypothetical protein CDG79_23915 [Nostoc sp. 'Peltigera membranacea cyanobiont' 232]